MHPRVLREPMPGDPGIDLVKSDEFGSNPLSVYSFWDTPYDVAITASRLEGELENIKANNGVDWKALWTFQQNYWGEVLNHKLAEKVIKEKQISNQQCHARHV